MAVQWCQREVLTGAEVSTRTGTVRAKPVWADDTGRGQNADAALKQDLQTTDCTHPPTPSSLVLALLSCIVAGEKQVQQSFCMLVSTHTQCRGIKAANFHLASFLN